MPIVLPQFQPEGQPGEATTVLQSALSEKQSMMERAAASQRAQEELAMRKEQFEVMKPVLLAKAQADIALAGATIANTKTNQDLRKQYADSIPQAQQDLMDALQTAHQHYTMNDDGSVTPLGLPDWHVMFQNLQNLRAKYHWMSATPEGSSFLKTIDNASSDAHVQSITGETLMSQQNIALLKAKLGATEAKSPLGKLQEDRTSALARGDVKAVNEIDKQIELSKFQNVAPELAGGAKSQMQESTADITQLVSLGGDLLTNLRPGDVGMAGNVGEWVGDRTLPQVGMNTADPMRIKNRTNLDAYRERALKRVTSDNRFSVSDREAIEKMLPSSGVFESYDDAKHRIQTVNLIMAQRAGILGGYLGEKPITDYSPDELKSAVQFGIPDRMGRPNPKNKLDINVAANILLALHPEVLQQEGE